MELLAWILMISFCIYDACHIYSLPNQLSRFLNYLLCTSVFGLFICFIADGLEITGKPKSLLRLEDVVICYIVGFTATYFLAHRYK